MTRNIHDIYDVILKIIAMVYGNTFLNYIRIEKKIKKELKGEFTTITGAKIYLDYLCELTDGTLCHIEFQYPKAWKNDLDRFFNYNITAQVRYQKITETNIVNFTPQENKEKIRKIGETKCFKPQYFYIGDIDFKKEIEKINIKVKSEKQLSSCEEITLMILCIVPDCKNRLQKLKKICNILKRKELFDESRFEFIQAIVRLEIDNLLTQNEQNKIKKEIMMSPKTLNTILQAIDEVNKKVISEAKMEGRDEGRTEAMKEIAKRFKNQIDFKELSSVTGLSIEEIEKL